MAERLRAARARCSRWTRSCSRMRESRSESGRVVARDGLLGGGVEEGGGVVEAERAQDVGEGERRRCHSGRFVVGGQVRGKRAS